MVAGQMVKCGDASTLQADLRDLSQAHTACRVDHDPRPRAWGMGAYAFHPLSLPPIVDTSTPA